MSYGWTANANSEGGGQSDRLPDGRHRVQIDKLVFGKRGVPFRTKNGDPQIMVVFADADDQEAALMITLSEKAGFVLARLLKRFGADTDKLEADGVHPRDFQEESFANGILVGLKGEIQVDYIEGSSYPEIEPVKLEGDAEPTQVSSGDHTPINEDDIPF